MYHVHEQHFFVIFCAAPGDQEVYWVNNYGDTIVYAYHPSTKKFNASVESASFLINRPFSSILIGIPSRPRKAPSKLHLSFLTQIKKKKKSSLICYPGL